MVKNSSQCFDIVFPNDIGTKTKASDLTSCFTKGYSRFTRGTGSVIYIGDEGDVKDLLEVLEAQETKEAKEATENSNAVGGHVSGMSRRDNGLGDNNTCRKLDSKEEGEELREGMGIFTNEDKDHDRPDRHVRVKDTLYTNITFAGERVDDDTKIQDQDQDQDQVSMQIKKQCIREENDEETDFELSKEFVFNPKTTVLRYFSPSELLSLFGFPYTFTFPDGVNISNRKKYELIGNSINVTVVSLLVSHAFEHTFLVDSTKLKK